MHNIQEWEAKFLREKVADRNGKLAGVVEKIIKGNTRIGYFIDDSELFTTAVIICNGVIFAGSTKRMDYAPSRDPHNEETGKEIALARAARGAGLIFDAAIAIKG